MPDFPLRTPDQLVNLEFDASEDEVAHGRDLFNRYCNVCHRFNGGGSIPDVTYFDPEIFVVYHQIVGKGAFLVNGMPDFSGRLPVQDISDDKNYILSSAKIKREDQTNVNTK